MKVLDVSMFFNEVELLEVRLNSLCNQVDQFVVIESSQTFTGRHKTPILPQLNHLKSRFGNQVIFISRDELHDCATSFIYDTKYLSRWFPVEVARIISQNTISVLNKISKPRIDSILDTFQRECCLFYILERVADFDYVIFSDADELPDNLLSLPSVLSQSGQSFLSLAQHEFWYYPNMYVNSDWLGSIFSESNAYASFPSLNYLRHKVGNARINTSRTSTIHGYHLTSMGGAERIKQKLQSWAHQELVNPVVLSNIEQNIASGQDIFYRASNETAILVDIGSYYSLAYSESILRSELSLCEFKDERKRSRLSTYLIRFISKLFAACK